MTKSSKSRIVRTTGRKKMAEAALHIAAHGRLIDVEVEGQNIKMWAMPASAHQVVMAALEQLAR